MHLTHDTDNEFAASLFNLSQRLELSLRDLAAICGGSAAGYSKDFFGRLFKGQVKEASIKELRPRLARGLYNQLLSNGLSASQALATLKAVFLPEEITTMITERTTLPPSACRALGLRRDPFDTTRRQSANDLWTSKGHDGVFEALMDAINHQGFVAVTGDIGTGKSTMKARVMDAVTNSETKMQVIWANCPNMAGVKPGSIMRLLLESLEQKCPQDPIARTRRLEMTLASLYAQDQRIALAFDEAHRLHDETLRSLKDFYELGTGGFMSYLGVILIGQPRLKTRLFEPQHRELAERIEVAEMPTLESTAWSYISHRVALVGGDVEKLFDEAAVKLLVKHANTPLALGNLCNKALKLAAKYSEPVTVQLLNERMGLRGGEPGLRAVKQA